MVVARVFALFRICLFLLAFMLPLCAQRLAMTAPSGPMDDQTDPQSNPTRPKMAPNLPNTSLQASLISFPRPRNSCLLHVRLHIDWGKFWDLKIRKLFPTKVLGF